MSKVLGQSPLLGKGSIFDQFKRWVDELADRFIKANAIALTGSSGGTVAAGATVYLGVSGQSATEAAVAMVVTKPGTVTRLYVASSAAPGASETFIYTLMVNGVASPVTGVTVSDPDTSGVDINPTVLVQNDTVSLRLVTSGGAAVTRHRWSLEIRYS